MKSEARLFKALADETRLKIVWLLLLAEELCVCDIMAVLGISQSKASRHLRYLYHAGWVQDRREGLWMYYRLAVRDRREGVLLPALIALLADLPEAQELRQRLQERLQTKKGAGEEELAIPGVVCACNSS